MFSSISFILQIVIGIATLIFIELAYQVFTGYSFFISTVYAEEFTRREYALAHETLSAYNHSFNFGLHLRRMPRIVTIGQIWADPVFGPYVFNMHHVNIVLSVKNRLGIQGNVEDIPWLIRVGGRNGHSQESPFNTYLYLLSTLNPKL